MADEARRVVEQSWEGRRPTVGLVVTWLRDKYENQILQGVHDVAQEAGINVICMVWGEMRREIPTEVIYNLISIETFSGLVLSPTIGHTVAPGGVQALCERYADVPIVSGALGIHGITQVMTDSYSGMRDVITHLVAQHTCRRLAFIRGPRGQHEAEERFRAYRDVLAEHGIPLDERYIARGDYRIETGREAMRVLLEREVSLDAVVAANDDMAMGAMQILQRQGYRIPDDLAVVGFDDKDEVRHLSAPLTTVRQPIYEFARQMTALLIRRIAGEDVPDEVLIPTQMVLRRSCGCFPAAVEVAASKVSVTFEAEAGADVGEIPPPAPERVPLEIWEGFLEEWQGHAASSNQRFLNAFDRVLQRDVARGHEIVTALREHLLAHVTRPQAWLQAENLLHQGRALAGDVARRAEGHRWVSIERREGDLESFDAGMSAAFSLAELVPVVEANFPLFDIHRCAIALYQDEPDATRDLQMFLTYQEGQAQVMADGPRFAAHELVARAGASDDRRYTMVVLLLSLRDRVLGHAIVEAATTDGIIYDRLGEQFSGTIFRIRLLKQQEQARHEAEMARVQSERALDDLMVLQRQQVRESWQDFTEGGVGYVVSDKVRGPMPDVWLPHMRAAVARGHPEKSAPEDDRSVLAVPVRLYDEIVGVLGIERQHTEVAAGEAWPAEDVTLVETVAEQVALALENQRLLDEVRRRAAQLRAAAEVGQLMSSVLDLDEALPEVARLIRERLGLYYVGIFLIEQSGRWAVLRAGTGEAGREMLARNHRLQVGGDSMIGACIAERRAKIALDVGEEAVRFNNPLLPDTHSEMALPLLSRGEPVGAMTIQAVEIAAFSEEDITTLQTMGDQLGSAIENARLLQQMEQSMQALESARGEYTLESWRNFMNRIGQSVGYRYDLAVQPAEVPRPEAHQALTQAARVTTSLAAEAAEEEEEGTAHSAVAVPIRLWDQTLGVVNVRFTDDAVPEETVALIEQITDQLALSLENVRLLEETRASAARERLTGEATARMRETLDIDTVLQTAVQEMGEILGLAETEVRLDVVSEGAQPQVRDVSRRRDI